MSSVTSPKFGRRNRHYSKHGLVTYYNIWRPTKPITGVLVQSEWNQSTDDAFTPAIAVVDLFDHSLHRSQQCGKQCFKFIGGVEGRPVRTAGEVFCPPRPNRRRNPSLAQAVSD